MTQEDKELLLKDLCARLPYEIKGIRIYKPEEIVTLNEIIPRCKMNPNIGNGSFCELGFDKISDFCTIAEFKPYLFPLSSMTEEQLYELKEITDLKYDQNTLELVEWNEKHRTLEFWLEEIPQYKVIEVFDWLNKNHFDYRCLIERGLAIDATGLNIY